MARGRAASKIKAPAQSSVRFLDASEQLFAELGYEGAKIRAITERAGVNLGTMHHYWGSKEALFQAVCERRFLPVNNESLRRIEEVAAATPPGQPVDLDTLVREHFAPFLFAATPDEKGTLFRRLLGRLLTDPLPEVRGISAKIFASSGKRFVELLRSTCPHLEDQEFYWRFHGVQGSILYTQMFNQRVARLAAGKFDNSDISEGLDHIVHFIATGLRAPPLRSSGGSR